MSSLSQRTPDQTWVAANDGQVPHYGTCHLFLSAAGEPAAARLSGDLTAERQRPGPELVALSDEGFGLPNALAASLRALESMPAPQHVERVDHWPDIVTDALSIARTGWAAKAMALGWSAGDLFGIGPRDDWQFSGLAVWLRGRTIMLLDQRSAIVADGQQRAAFNRGGMGHGTHPSVAPVMLWEFGR